MIRSRPSWTFPAAIVLAGINLRPSIAIIGPLLDKLQHDTALSDTMASLLTTLPVALMGGFLLGARHLRAALGDRGGVAIGLILIMIGDIVRSFWPSASVMLVTAIIGGAGIAAAQALMPAVIRHYASRRAAGLMGLYSTAIMGGALLSGMAGPWLARAGGLSAAFGFWALPAAAGLLVWWGLVDPTAMRSRLAARSPQIYRRPRAWLLIAFFGLGTGAYTLILAWLPPFYTQLGWSDQRAGGLLGIVTLAEVVAGLAVSLWIDRRPDRRPALFWAIAALLVGMLCLAIAPLALAWLAAILAGLGVGALFPLSLIVAADHGEAPENSGAIAAFVQGGGYGLAALLPLLAGLLRQRLGDLTPAWWLMAFLCLVLALIAFRLRPSARIPILS